MGLNGSIEGSNPSFSASAAPAAVLRPPAEGWQSGRMRRSRKPLSVVRRIEGSNPSPSAPRAETDAGNRVWGARAGVPGLVAERTGTSRDPLTRPRTGARPARAGGPKAGRLWPGCPVTAGVGDAQEVAQAGKSNAAATDELISLELGRVG